MASTAKRKFKAGTVGKVMTTHISDGAYSSSAKVVTWGRKWATVELLEDYYCCEKGEVIKVSVKQFTPD